jgi:OFA family oxalate/formate antiporter-like MFS transporter
VSASRPEESPGGPSPSWSAGRRLPPLASAVAVNAAAGTLFAWSVLLPALTTEFGLPAGELGMVFASALVVFSLAVLLSGGAVDRHGPRRATALAGVLSGCGLAVAAVAPSVLVLHLGIGVLFGFGSGLAYLGAVAWASTRGRLRRRDAIGVVVAAYAAGPVAAAPLGALGTERWGWRVTLAVAAAIVAGVTVLASRGLPGPMTAPLRGAEPVTAGPIGDAIALAALWLLFLGTVVPGLLAFAYAAEIATERGVSSDTAGVVVAVMAVGNVAGRLLSTPLCTRVGLLAALWTSLGALVLALVALAWPSSGAVVVLSLPLLALQYGLVSALLPAAIREVSGEVRFGTAYGRVFSSWGVAGLVGPALGAALHDGADGYARSFQASLLGAMVAVLALIAYQRRLRLGRVPEPKSST